MDIDWNLLDSTPMPVESNSAEIVYSSHTIEHITDSACQNMFSEAYRILKPKGLFRVTAPDIDLAHKAYKAHDRYFFFWMPDNSIQQLFLLYFASNSSVSHPANNGQGISNDELDRIFIERPYEDAIDFCVSRCSVDTQRKYPSDHINAWNSKKLLKFLKEAGFINSYISAFGQSASPVLRDISHFDNTKPQVSVYVEAIK